MNKEEIELLNLGYAYIKNLTFMGSSCRIRRKNKLYTNNVSIYCDKSRIYFGVHCHV